MNSKFELAQLPLVLAGPILRQTTSTSVTVWLAVQMACHVELTIRVTHRSGEQLAQPVMKGDRQTIQLGKSLHIVAVTATIDTFSPQREQQRPCPPNEHQVSGCYQQPLTPGVIYAYDLSFNPIPTDADTKSKTRPSQTSPILLVDALKSPLLPNVSISYFAHGLPTFTLCPEKIEQLQLFHGSCRNVEDRGYDALPIVDCAAAHFASQPNHRPHQLLFTGDQIYGDEVADPFLWAILQVQDALMGWQEPLPVGQRFATKLEQHLKPGCRSSLATEEAGLTASLQNTPEKASSHLFRFSEYCIAYLFSWSQCLWQINIPTAQSMGQDGKAAQRWDLARKHLHRNRESQPLVRRILANVPTYMIFDDHDVSDDWNLNQAWCEKVLTSPLGSRVVQNGMLAYALFQGWGNTPEQFESDTSGEVLLEATAKWCWSCGQDSSAAKTLAQNLGLPQLSHSHTALNQIFSQDDDSWVLPTEQLKLNWHYSIQGTCHQILVLDTRTQRGYPVGDDSTAPPQLLSQSAFNKQLQQIFEDSSGPQQNILHDFPPVVTFVVAPTNVFTLQVLDWIQSLALKMNRAFDADIGDSWNLESKGRAKLLTSLLKSNSSVVILSGDIHFGASLKVDYQLDNSLEPERADGHKRQNLKKEGSLIQLTASAICNSETLTGLLHTKLKSLFPERSRRWVGWQDPAIQIEVTSPIITWLKQRWLRRKARHKPLNSLTLEERARLSSRLPDWRYETTWLKRQPAQHPTWASCAPSWLAQAQGRLAIHSSLTRKLWYNRWLQEGTEVVGFNNIGLVHFTCDRPNGELSVQHDLYWYSSWGEQQIVYSRFEAELK